MSLKSMFEHIVDSYDLINHFLTWGLDDLWRGISAKECASGMLIVDLCCGTAKHSFQIVKRANPEALVIGLDFSKAMLRKAAEKEGHMRRKRKLIDNSQDNRKFDLPYVDFILSDSTFLPFKDGCIDRIGISFSFRNLLYKNPKGEASLKEVLRTLRSGGKFVCVETSQPRVRPLTILYHMYLKKAVPFIGGLISRRKFAYRYLGTSAINFPGAEKIADILLRAGFRRVSRRQLTFGVTAIHVGVK